MGPAQLSVWVVIRQDVVASTDAHPGEEQKVSQNFVSYCVFMGEACGGRNIRTASEF